MTLRIAGVDEAGRGPLVGPVIAAAVILNPHRSIPGIKDSKALNEKTRETLFEQILAHALSVGIGRAEPQEIDALNIHHATLLAMKRAVENLSLPPDEVWVDGKYLPRWSYTSRAIIQGDKTEVMISAASIIAKVTRDREMRILDTHFPGYGFAQHKGYPTSMHLEALKALGLTPHHRRSYRPVQLLLDALPL
ncbi:MAG TPA: ribonuclease HII [Coxiellaceae bacterium]|nr:ribonuclease HII [Coxiellaceae bacterium]